MTKSILRLLSASVLTAVGLMATGAQAGPVWVRLDPVLNGGLFAAGFGTSVAVSSDSGTSFQTFRAGAFTLQSNAFDPPVDPWRAFVTYCFELAQFIKLGSGQVLYESSALSAPGLPAADRLTSLQTDAISRLWSNRFATSTTPGNVVADVENAGQTSTEGQRSAAFQVAVWDIVLDGDNGLDGLTTGAFRVQELPLNSDNVNVRSLAASYLNVAYGSDDIDGLIRGLFHDTNQNLLFPLGQEGTKGADEEVPAPATLLLLGAGLAILATQRRRSPHA